MQRAGGLLVFVLRRQAEMHAPGGCGFNRGASLTMLAPQTPHILAPPPGWPEDALEAMFEEFWRSGAPMAGQPGAAGWASWIAGEPGGATTAAAAAEGSKRRRQRREEAAAEERRQQEQQQQQQGAAEQGTSWSGWEEMAPAIRARFGHSLRMEEGAGEEAEGAAAVAGEDGEEGLEDEEEAEEDQPPEEETDEQLLER